MEQNFLSQCSAVLIVKNGARTLERCLNSLSEFSEVIIYDNGSTDESLNIAKKFSNVILFQGEFLGFGDSKNYATSLAKNDWIFSLDCDEYLDKKLLQSLKNFSPKSNHLVGKIYRENHFCGKAISTNGWRNDYLIRLYNRKTCQFSSRLVHEKVILSPNSKVVSLSGKLIHQTIFSLSQQLQKIDLYSELYAQSQEAKYYPFIIILLKTHFAFLRSYVLRGGFFSGWRGFTIAVGESVGVFYKYNKVYAQKKEDRSYLDHNNT